MRIVLLLVLKVLVKHPNPVGRPEILAVAIPDPWEDPKSSSTLGLCNRIYTIGVLKSKIGGSTLGSSWGSGIPIEQSYLACRLLSSGTPVGRSP